MNQPRDKFGRWTKKVQIKPNPKVRVFQDNGFDLIPIGTYTLNEFETFSKKEGGNYVTQTLT